MNNLGMTLYEHAWPFSWHIFNKSVVTGNSDKIFFSMLLLLKNYSFISHWFAKISPHMDFKYACLVSKKNKKTRMYQSYLTPLPTIFFPSHHVINHSLCVLLVGRFWEHCSTLARARSGRCFIELGFECVPCIQQAVASGKSHTAPQHKTHLRKVTTHSLRGFILEISMIFPGSL